VTPFTTQSDRHLAARPPELGEWLCSLTRPLRVAGELSLKPRYGHARLAQATNRHSLVVA
jgi:hypothetical protein